VADEIVGVAVLVRALVDVGVGMGATTANWDIDVEDGATLWLVQSALDWKTECWYVQVDVV